MADDKQKDENEIVGLEDEAQSKEQAVGLKRFLLPAVIGAVVFAAAMAVTPLLLNKKPAEIKPVMKEIPKADSSATVEVISFPIDSFANIQFDTAEALKELAFLDAANEKKADTSVAIKAPVKDSSDTLSALQKQIDKLAEERAAIDKKKKELDSLNQRIAAGINKLEQAETTRIINLARLYDGMRPDEVAKLFENLDDTLVVAIIPRMKPANAAKLLALLPPKRAASISTQLITVAGQ